MSKTSELCAVIRERVEKGDLPRQYMKLPYGFKLESTGHGLVLSHPDLGLNSRTIGHADRGNRWTLDINWRDYVANLVMILKIEDPEEEVPF